LGPAIPSTGPADILVQNVLLVLISTLVPLATNRSMKPHLRRGLKVSHSRYYYR